MINHVWVNSAHFSVVSETLVDIAVSLAARNEQVLYWCRDYEYARHLYGLCHDLPGIADLDFIDDRLMLRWPDLERGCVKFGHSQSPNLRGWRCTVVINDLVRCPLPEALHAHTIVNGG